MIGNDVVDLATAKKESNWQRKGFLDKLFTTSEQKLIKKASNPDEMVWMLWSIKESTYKAYQRLNYNRGFYPTKIAVKNIKLIDSQYSSEISLFGTIFYGQSSIENQIIATNVVLNIVDFNKLAFSNTIMYSKDANGLPFCKTTKKPISISHHGNCKKIVQIN